MEIRFGVRGHDILKNTDIDSFLDAVSSFGFTRVQFVMKKALTEVSFKKEDLAYIASAFKKRGLSISMLGAYFNPVHPDKKKAEEGMAFFKECLKHSKELEAPYVGSETGSYNGDKWTYNPLNRTEEAYQKVLKTFKELDSYAEVNGGEILIEPAYGHVIFDAERLKRLCEELDSPRVHVTIDLFNLLYEGSFQGRDSIFLSALKAFKDEIKVIHLKDASIKDGKMVQLAPGEGDFNYPLMLKAIQEYCPKAVCTFEGVGPESLHSSLLYLKNIAKTI